MNEKGDAARKARKLRASRDRWKQRAADKQQQIRHLRVTVRDLSASREHWKARVKELEHQLQVIQSAQDSPDAGGPAVYIVFGGERLRRSRSATRPIPHGFPND